jgi:hypothetical protein
VTNELHAMTSLLDAFAEMRTCHFENAASFFVKNREISIQIAGQIRQEILNNLIAS